MESPGNRRENPLEDSMLNNRAIQSANAHSLSPPGGALEVEIRPNHRLRRAREGAGGAIQAGQVRCFIKVPAVLETQAEVGQQSPVEAGSVNIHRLGR